MFPSRSLDYSCRMLFSSSTRTFPVNNECSVIGVPKYAEKEKTGTKQRNSSSHRACRAQQQSPCSVPSLRKLFLLRFQARSLGQVYALSHGHRSGHTNSTRRPCLHFPAWKAERHAVPLWWPAEALDMMPASASPLQRTQNLLCIRRKWSWKAEKSRERRPSWWHPRLRFQLPLSPAALLASQVWAM